MKPRSCLLSASVFLTLLTSCQGELPSPFGRWALQSWRPMFNQLCGREISQWAELRVTRTLAEEGVVLALVDGHGGLIDVTTTGAFDQEQRSFLGTSWGSPYERGSSTSTSGYNGHTVRFEYDDREINGVISGISRYCEGEWAIEFGFERADDVPVQNEEQVVGSWLRSAWGESPPSGSGDFPTDSQPTGRFVYPLLSGTDGQFSFAGITGQMVEQHFVSVPSTARGVDEALIGRFDPIGGTATYESTIWEGDSARSYSEVWALDRLQHDVATE